MVSHNKDTRKFKQVYSDNNLFYPIVFFGKESRTMSSQVGGHNVIIDLGYSTAMPNKCTGLICNCLIHEYHVGEYKKCKN